MAEARAAVLLYRKTCPSAAAINLWFGAYNLPRDNHGFLVLGATRAPILDMLPGTTDDARDTAREGGAQSPV